MASVRLGRMRQQDLVCGRCANHLAQVTLGRFTRPHLVGADGFEVFPSGGWLLFQARQELETAQITRVSPEHAAEHRAHLDSVGKRLEFLESCHSEPYYEFACPRCHASYLRTVPMLVADLRGSDNGRVALTRQPQDVG